MSGCPPGHDCVYCETDNQPLSVYDRAQIARMNAAAKPGYIPPASTYDRRAPKRRVMAPGPVGTHSSMAIGTSDRRSTHGSATTKGGGRNWKTGGGDPNPYRGI